MLMILTFNTFFYLPMFPNIAAIPCKAIVTTTIVLGRWCLPTNCRAAISCLLLRRCGGYKRQLCLSSITIKWMYYFLTHSLSHNFSLEHNLHTDCAKTSSEHEDFLIPKHKLSQELSWVRTVSHQMTRQIMDSLHYYFPWSQRTYFESVMYNLIQFLKQIFHTCRAALRTSTSSTQQRRTEDSPCGSILCWQWPGL